MKPKDQSRPGRFIYPCLMAVLGAVVVAASLHGLMPLPVRAAAVAGSADDFMPVDCLLPGKVRKLGTRVTFLTPRLPIKTSAVECGIRGGEYTAYDRADYRTALAVWLPQAEQGDAQAQNYVGEIHERGLGVPPDHELAASWYRKAAEQGFAPAQINIGQLYEQGLGVAQNRATSIDWYRKAAHLPDGLSLSVAFGDPEVERALRQDLSERDQAIADQRAEIQELTRRLDASATRRANLQKELDASTGQLKTDSAALTRERAQLREQAAQLADERTRLDDARDRSSSAESAAKEAVNRQQELAVLSDQLDARTQDIESRETALTGQATALDDRSHALAASEQRLDKQRRQLASGEDASSLERRALAAESSRLAREAARLDTLGASIKAEKTALAAARETAAGAVQSEAEQVAARRLELDDKASALAARERQLDDQRRGLARDNAALDERSSTLSAFDLDFKERRQELADGEAALDSEQQSLDVQSAQLADQASRLEALRAELDAERDQLAKTRSEIAAAQNAIVTLDARLDEMRDLELALEGREQQLAENERRLTARTEVVDQKSRELDLVKRQLEELREQVTVNRNQLADISAESAGADASDLPVIEMIEPQLPETRGQPVIMTRSGVDQRTIIGRVRASGGLRQFFINDREAEVDEGGFFQQSIPVAAAGTAVSLVAVDNNGRRSVLNFKLQPETLEELIHTAASAPDDQASEALPIPDIDYGRYHALVIGNKEYEHLPDLFTPIVDANAVADILSDKYGFEVTLITNATRYDILSALNQYRATLNQDDNLLIYYAGHGELDAVNNRGHWLPVDAELDSTANWISNITITDILNSMNARKILVVADSCYSGALTRSTLARLDAANTEDERTAWLKTVAKKKTRIAFSSGGVAPTLDGGGGRHSIFAKAFLDMLALNNTVLEGRILHRQVALAVNYSTSAVQFEQVPQYAGIKYAGHEGGDFLFVPGGKSTR